MKWFTTIIVQREKQKKKRETLNFFGLEFKTPFLFDFFMGFPLICFPGYWLIIIPAWQLKLYNSING